MKPWLKWSSKAEVQQWDTCPEPTGVAVDWLFDKINLDHKIQIKYVDTKYQLADILTKGNFTRDEWNNPFICSKSASLAYFAALRISA